MSERLMTRREASERMGVTERTLDKKLRAGTGPSYTRIGRRVLFRERDFDDWVKSLPMIG